MTQDSGSTPVGESSEERFQALVESFLRRYRAGESPSVREYAEKDPDLARKIEECFPAMQFLEGREEGSRGGATRAPASAADRINAESELGRLGEFRLIREVGRGGMGVVYEAEQESLRRRVALKVLPFHSRMDERLLQRFQREAQAAARLQHPNIVPVYGIGEEHGIHYYAMQLVDGLSLQAVLPEMKRLKSSARSGSSGSSGASSQLSTSIALQLLSESFGNVARVGLQVAEVLSYAHGQGMLHRDIKPANVLIDSRGWTWVADLGLAKAIDMEDLTQSGELVGTLRYMAPERFEGSCDERSDIYSLGLTLYEVLTQQPPFEAQSREGLLKSILHEPLRPPREVDRSLPSGLEVIVLKAAAKSPAQRYQKALEMAEDLERFLGGKPIRASLPVPEGRPWYEATWSKVKRHTILSLVSFSAILAVAAIYAILVARTPQGSLPVGDFPSHLIVEDLDRDGVLDLVTVNTCSNDISILRNRGAGIFRKAEPFQVGDFPMSAVPADLDGDRDPDLAVAKYESRDVALLFNDGAGSFEGGRDLPLGDHVMCVAAADLDGDQDVDLAMTGGKDRVWVSLNDGAGKFEAGRTCEAAASPWPIAAADIDGDGRLDLVTANGGPAFVSIFINKGGGAFAETAHQSGVPAAGHLLAEDLDGDGDTDLAGTALREDSRVTRDLWILRNDGGARFAPVEIVSLSSFVEALTGGDLDNDGDIDLAIVGGVDDLHILRNPGGAKYETAAHLRVGTGPAYVAAADLDGDGFLDLIVSDTRSNEVRILWSKGGAFGVD